MGTFYYRGNNKWQLSFPSPQKSLRLSWFIAFYSTLSFSSRKLLCSCLQHKMVASSFHRITDYIRDALQKSELLQRKFAGGRRREVWWWRETTQSGIFNSEVAASVPFFEKGQKISIPFSLTRSSCFWQKERTNHTAS